ncbi:hypothetical protein RhiLY_10750 [Ceratobasidium sp. AG-Ba]|nr:hypothetical protein RhiLY_10750 [Ceratobasidium sp. AG-Ba]
MPPRQSTSTNAGAGSSQPAQREKDPRRVAAAKKAAETRKANQAARVAEAAQAAEAYSDAPSAEPENTSAPPADKGKSEEKEKSTLASRMQPKPTASAIRSVSPTGNSTGSTAGNQDEELSGSHVPQYVVRSKDPTVGSDAIEPPANMISQANDNQSTQPVLTPPAEQVPVPLPIPVTPPHPRPATPEASQPPAFDPDAREQQIGTAVAADIGDNEAMDAYISAFACIQAALLKSEEPRKEAIARADDRKRYCIGVATIAFAGPGGIKALFVLENGVVQERINPRPPRPEHVEALKEKFADAHKKTDFKTPILIWARDADVDPSILESMKKGDLYGVSEEVPILQIVMTPREKQLIHELYWTMTQPHLNPDYDPVRNKHIQPRWLTQEELNDRYIELGRLRDDRKFFTLANGQHRIAAMVELAQLYGEERLQILAAARTKAIPQAELDIRLKACCRPNQCAGDTPEDLLLDLGTNTSHDPQHGEEQAELIWMTAQRYKGMIKSFVKEDPNIQRRDAFNAARIQYIKRTGVDSLVDNKPGDRANPIEIEDEHSFQNLQVAPPGVQQEEEGRNDGGDEEPSDDQDDAPPKSNKEKRAQKKKKKEKAAAATTVARAHASHLSGVKNGAAVFQRIMSYSPYVELVMSTCGAYVVWNTSLLDVHATVMLKPAGAVLAMHLWLDLEILINLASASETGMVPQILAFVQRNQPKPIGYPEATNLWNSAYGRATSQPPGMSSWTKIAKAFSTEFAKHFKLAKAQDVDWPDENMWTNKNIATHRDIFYRVGADPVLREGTDQDRLFGAMMQLYALVELARRPLPSHALNAGSPHSEDRRVPPVARFWPPASFPCKSRIAAYTRRVNGKRVPSGESMLLLTFLFGRNFPMWLYHGGIDKNLRLWSRWYEVNPGFTHVLLAGFEAAGVGCLEARLSLVIDIIEDKHLLDALAFVEQKMAEKNLSMAQVMQECAVLSSHRYSSGSIKKGDGCFEQALARSGLDMPVEVARTAWKVAVNQTRDYLEHDGDRVNDLLERNPVLTIISRLFWDHVQLRRWADGIPEGQPRTLIPERALAWGICLDQYQHIVVEDCLIRYPQVKTIIEFVEKVCNISRVEPWFKGLFDTAQLSQRPPPALSPPSSPPLTPALDADLPPPAASGRQARSPSPMPSTAPARDSGSVAGTSRREKKPVDYTKPDIEQLSDEMLPDPPNHPKAAGTSTTSKQAASQRAADRHPTRQANPLPSQVEVVLPTLAQVRKGQKSTQRPVTPDAPDRAPEPHHRSPAPIEDDAAPEQLPPVDEDMPGIKSNDDHPSPEQDAEMVDAAGKQSSGLSLSALADTSSYEATTPVSSQHFFDHSIANESVALKAQLEPMNMCQLIRSCLPDEISCLPKLSLLFLHTMDASYLQFRGESPEDKNDLRCLLQMEGMEARMNRVSECIWAAREDLRAELLNYAQYIGRSRYPMQMLLNQLAVESRQICLRFFLQLCQNVSDVAGIDLDEATSEMAWMVKTDGLFDNTISHAHLNTASGQIELWLNFKHTFPLIQQSHLDLVRKLVLVRGFVLGNMSVDDLRRTLETGSLAHPVAGTGVTEQGRVYRSLVAMQAQSVMHDPLRENVYVCRRGSPQYKAPDDYLPHIGLQLSKPDVVIGNDLLTQPSTQFKLVTIPEDIANMRLLWHEQSPFSLGFFVLGGEFRDPEEQAWQERDLHVLGDWDKLGVKLRDRRNELAQAVAADWDEQSMNHIERYESWVKKQNLHTQKVLDVLPDRRGYYNRINRFAGEERARRHRPLFNPGSSVPPMYDEPAVAMPQEVLPSPEAPAVPDRQASVAFPEPEGEDPDLLSTQADQEARPALFKTSNLALSQKRRSSVETTSQLPDLSTQPVRKGRYDPTSTSVLVPDESPDEGEEEEEEEEEEAEAGEDMEIRAGERESRVGIATVTATGSPIAQTRKSKRHRDSIATTSSGGASGKAKKKARTTEEEEEDSEDS